MTRVPATLYYIVMTIEQMIQKMQSLKNVRRSQTGQKAAATQRKIDALYNEIRKINPDYR